MDSFYIDVNDKVVCWYKRSIEKTSNKVSMDKREDEAKNGDGVVTMKTHEKN